MATPVYQYKVCFDESRERFTLDRPKGDPKWPSGLFAYRWHVEKPDGEKRFLAGVSQAIGRRLSQYIATFNRPSDDSALSHLVRDRDNSVSVEVFGPYDETQDEKELEEDFIRQIPEAERLNKTSGGNGGGAWSQYAGRSPSKGVYANGETPEKYHLFQRRVTEQENPGVKIELPPSPYLPQSGVYVIKRFDGDKQDRYIGESSGLRKRLRVHASHALSEEPPTKIAKAIAQSPERYGVGVIPSTSNATPRTLRRAEKEYIESCKPRFNTRGGGGGPTVMPGAKKEKDPTVRRLNFSDPLE